jgi:hypothetical protein
MGVTHEDIETHHGKLVFKCTACKIVFVLVKPGGTACHLCGQEFDIGIDVEEAGGGRTSQ